MLETGLQFESSWDDGSKFDVKLAALLKKYKIPAFFFIPTNCELNDEEIIEISKDFQIGGHTTSHPRDLQVLSRDEQYEEISANKDWLEQLTGKKCLAFCYPRGRFNDEVVSVVKDCGFYFARTTISGNIKQPNDLLRIHPTVHVYPERKDCGKPEWFSEAKKLFLEAEKTKGYFHIWGHSHELERYNLWSKLEEFFIWLRDERKFYIGG